VLLVAATAGGSAIGYLQFCQQLDLLYFLRILKYHFLVSTIFPVPLICSIQQQIPLLAIFFTKGENLSESEINWSNFL
jgi:hypothetical protein